MLKRWFGLCAISLSSVLANETMTDEFLWLEEIESSKSLQWAETQNNQTLKKFEADPRYSSMNQEALSILESNDKIPYIKIRGDYLYNFWRDEKSIRGLWRRTTLEEYKKDQPNWEIVLDVDALAKKEDENWVFKGAVCLAPDYERCLVQLSRGGKDAKVYREFDLKQKKFVPDGFKLKEAKSSVTWVHKDMLLVSTDFGPQSMTKSGYPRIVKKWKRGQLLEQAEKVYEVSDNHLGLWVGTQVRPERDYFYLYEAMTFWKHKIHIFDEQKSIIDSGLPEDADFQAWFNGKAIAIMRKKWKDIPAGAVFSMDLKTKHHQLIYEPGDRVSVSNVSTSKDALLINILDNISSSILEVKLDKNQWKTKILPFPNLGNISVSPRDSSNDYFVSMESFLNPDSYKYYQSEENKFTIVKSLKKRFNDEGLKVEQWHSTSKDGTKVPYFIVSRKDLQLNGNNPTVLYGYGGFEIPLNPSYLSITGKLWLEKGGIYVLSNIRGGGEFGPKWHQAALKKNRHKAYEDFISIAEDLIQRKVTSPRRLGISGGSNGGLLMGVMLTQRPDLFNAIVCSVPLLDMLRYHKLLAGASWIGEYGDPEKPDMYEYLKSYSPYHNVFSDKDYPEIFIMTSTKDDRVHPGHARKMVAKMKKQEHQVLYYENIEGGHGGASNLKQSARQAALKYIYFHQKLFD